MVVVESQVAFQSPF